MPPTAHRRGLEPRHQRRPARPGSPYPYLRERRSSGFLLWGGVGAGLWVTPTYWPDFTHRHLTQALTHCRKAQRR
ncbi:undecaprenyl diphosphate synthase family protein [Streptomyces sp. NPDC086182]|uniref:undecaprenyl diphosphate synthase family protein n=1 Tax=Streptomyces sp. NPDC086182 TaxID=3155058 RepID=UPI00342BB806